MLFLVLPRWRSQGLSCMVSFSQKLSEEKDWRDRLCLSVLLTPLDLHNVDFQIFKIPLTFYLDFLAALKPEDDFVKLLC